MNRTVGSGNMRTGDKLEGRYMNVGGYMSCLVSHIFSDLTQT